MAQHRGGAPDLHDSGRQRARPTSSSDSYIQMEAASSSTATGSQGAQFIAFQVLRGTARRRPLVWICVALIFKCASQSLLRCGEHDKKGPPLQKSSHGGGGGKACSAPETQPRFMVLPRRQVSSAWRTTRLSRAAVPKQLEETFGAFVSGTRDGVSRSPAGTPAHN